MTRANEEARRARAEARRRAGLTGGKVLAGTPKPALFTDLTLTERLEAMWRLCLAQWLAGHPPPQPLERADWPGEVFDIEAERAAGRPKDLADVAWLEAHPDDKES